MEAFQKMVLWALCCQLMVIPLVSGLKCYECKGISSTNTLTAEYKEGLKTLGFVESGCHVAMSAKMKESPATCEDAQSGYEQRCSLSIAGGSAQIGNSATITGTIYTRGCALVPSGTANPVTSVIPSGTALYGLTVLSATAVTTFCTTDLCNAQVRMSPEKTCLMIGLLLTLLYGRSQ